MIVRISEPQPRKNGPLLHVCSNYVTVDGLNSKGRILKTSAHVHPKSLRVFFMTEMWERYGFYVVQTLLILYLTFHFHWNDERAFELVGSFTAMTYISPFIGGWIADRYIGQKRAVILATVILFISYVTFALYQSSEGLMIALAGIAVGTGLLKPNISSLLGNEYSMDSPKRENGFTIFYMGITTGIILGSTVPTLIHHHFGWSFSFLSAALGIIFAFLIFIVGISQYNIQDYQIQTGESRFTKLVLTFFFIAILFYCSLEIFDHPAFANWIFSIIVTLSVIYLIISVVTAHGDQMYRNMIIGLLCLISTLFWTFYFQMFSSFALLITRTVAPTLLGINLPAPYYVAIQSFGLIFFGLLFAREKHHNNFAEQTVHIGRKFSTAMLVMTGAYAVTSLILQFNLNTGLISPLLIIPVYLMISVAELLLSPVGLAAITLLSSPSKVSTMMGIFFVSLGTGGFLSGKIASMAAIPGGDLPQHLLRLYYKHAFTKMLMLLIIATILCYGVNSIIRHLLKNHTQQHA